MTWDRRLDAAIRRVTGPEDEPDEEVNGDPDSTLGEDDESGFDEAFLWDDWQAYHDDGFDDAEGEDEDDDDEEDEDDEDE